MDIAFAMNPVRGYDGEPLECACDECRFAHHGQGAVTLRPTYSTRKIRDLLHRFLEHWRPAE